MLVGVLASITKKRSQEAKVGAQNLEVVATNEWFDKIHGKNEMPRILRFEPSPSRKEGRM